MTYEHQIKSGATATAVVNGVRIVVGSVRLIQVTRYV